MVSVTRTAQSTTNQMALLFPMVIAVVTVSVVAVGWLQRDEEYLTPGSGAGYWLGIYGSMAMLLLLIYSLRKRRKSARAIGTIPFWFRTHMLLGILGPVLILFHANFKLGALNSNVAFFAMLIVAASGIIGRYIYRKIHVGLYGRRARVRELLAAADALRGDLGHDMQAAAVVAQRMKAFSDSIEAKVPTNALGSLGSGAIIAARARRLRINLVAESRALIRKEGSASGWSRSQRRAQQRRIEHIIRLYAASVRKAAHLAFFERLFALWHVLHLPLFFLMLLAGVVHVWAVHHY